jgi:iron complex outermembrane recepter protein
MRKRGAPFLFLLFFSALLAFSPAPSLAQPSQSFDLTGVVVDVTGAAVAGAEVTVDGAGTETDARGRFALAVPRPEVRVHVRAPGFAEFAGRVRSNRPARITLHPAGVAESLTVTAGRSPERLADTAAAVTVVTSGAMLTSAASAADDLLRSVPGFSLFRRSSSRVANPTTQGVSLRGLAASGATRGLVLADGTPLNDPYGGWVYWDRVPQVAIDRIEVVRGSGSESLYGLNAIGGALQVLTIEPRAPSGRLSLERGQHGMARASAYAGTRHGSWDGFVSGERYVLDGFRIVAPAERGPVDTNAGLRYANVLAAAGWSRPGLSLDVRANWLDEDRHNGTPLQRNDTNLRSIALTGRASGGGGLFSFTAFGGATNYDQSFSAVSADRSTERLTARQRVASDNVGGSLQWHRQWSASTLLIGGEALRVSGGGTLADTGIQYDSAVYSQFAFEPISRLEVAAGARGGLWSTTPEHAIGFVERRPYMLPRVSVTWAQTPGLSLTASWSHPGRTPTLNELYRDFRVGNIFTEHNVHLAPEEAQAVEAGVRFRRRAVSARVVGFWTRLDDAITNVTLGSFSGQILRQRRNAGIIRARGIESEGEWRLASWAALIASVAFTDSRFVRSEEPGLAGKRVPQVPRWQGTLSARLTRGRAIASVDWRSTSAQFDDDQNRFALRTASVLDLYVGASLPRGVQPFVAAENLFDAEVDVGRTPVRTVGTPRSLRAGVRVFVP